MFPSIFFKLGGKTERTEDDEERERAWQGEEMIRREMMGRNGR